MKKWVRESFEQCNSEKDKDTMEEQLKVFVNNVISDGSAWTINWKLKKLFRYFCQYYSSFSLSIYSFIFLAKVYLYKQIVL